MLTKVCSKCQTEKSLDEFHVAPTGRLGVRGDCKQCVRDRQNEVYHNDPKANYERSKKSLCECGKIKTRYSVKCQECARPSVDPNSPNWRVNKQGYIVAMVNKKEIRQHRFIMEKHLGRELLPHENVHHINGDRADNRIENLELWSVSQPAGQRVEDKLQWCRWFLEQYGG